MHSQPRMYADDNSITYASNDVEEIERCINIDLDRIRIWFAANKLTLNTTKTEFVLHLLLFITRKYTFIYNKSYINNIMRFTLTLENISLVLIELLIRIFEYLSIFNNVN